MSAAVRVIIMSVVAGVMYAAIAYFANDQFGQSAAVKAAIIQGITCMIATVCTASLMEFMFKIPNALWQKYLLASAGSGFIVLSVFVVVHSLLGTPNIIGTILPAAILGTPYYGLYPMALVKSHKSQMDATGINKTSNA